MKTLKETLMLRDGINESEALDRIALAIDDMNDYLAEGDLDGAENICREHFGLEPDFLTELL